MGRKGFFRRTSKGTIYLIIGLILLLIAGRIALPYIVLKYVNKTLNNIEGYSGHVHDIGISLYRGAYKIEGIKIYQTGGKVPVPFFSSPLVDLSIEWEQIFNGHLVAEIVVVDPELNFVAQVQTGESVDWREPIRELVPVNINRLEIVNGTVYYKDFNSDPKVNLYANSLDAVATNLTNSEDVSETLVATVDADAMAMGQAPMVFAMTLDPFENKGTFKLDFKMEELDVTKVNDFLDAYIKIDAERGTFSVYSEFEADKGAFKGYVKPLIHDLKILSLREDSKEPIKMVWEAFVGIFTQGLENQPHDQLATVMQFEGDLSNPDLNIMKMIGQIFKNAFIKVLPGGLEGENGEIGGVKESKDEKEDKGLKKAWKKVRGKEIDGAEGDDDGKDKKEE